jgi:hypothetical protein
MKKTSLYIALSLASLSIAPLHAEQSEPPVPAVIAPKPITAFGANPQPMPSFAGPQSGLTPEEAKILGQARLALQKDPELLDLNNQIKVLMEKRTKLVQEKLQVINPEAAAIQQKLDGRQEKMMAERRAQMEAMQAKYKAQSKVILPPDAPSPAPKAAEPATTPAH